MSRKSYKDHGECTSCTADFGSAVTLQDPETKEWTQMKPDHSDSHPIYQRLLQGQGRPTKQEVTGTIWETCCRSALRLELVMQENVLYFQDSPPYLRRTVAPTSAATAVLRR
ncbi:hypothetical protein P879_02251 [Paragonimus westermani]|uniref:Uncharacterized protein n=1 Tax=Paragonimus westermani TaxID=34504 RepID=A0A8T0DYA0_9TREM|nr:hypothetical protein P879_02251 [Paragonimus westermani]